MRAPDRSVAAFDSGAGMVSALAAALHGRPFSRLGQGRAAAAAVLAAGRIPRAGRQALYSVSGALEAVPPRALGDIDLDEVARWLGSQYPARRYPAVVIGAANGAVLQLAAAAGIPWLPQTLLVPVRWRGNDPDRPDLACEWGQTAAQPLLAANPDIELHHMHDGAQDRLMISQMAYFRVKRRTLGEVYERLLDRWLLPEAPVIVLQDGSSWPVTRVAERHVFQTGAYGGLAPEEYLSQDHAPPADAQAAEAEWGTTASFVDSVHAWAGRRGHPVLTIKTADPQNLAGRAADVQRHWLGDDAAGRLLISCFIQLDPWQVLRIGAVNYWTVFPVRRCLQAATDYLRDRKPFGRVDAMLFNHGTNSARLATEGEWRRLTEAGSEAGALLGMRGHEYPADFASLVRAHRDLSRLPPGPPWSTLPITELTRLSEAGSGGSAAPEVERARGIEPSS
jgi:hypothetical protein